MGIGLTSRSVDPVLTTTGAPSTGTHEVGRIAVDAVGRTYVCVTAGSPGTWRRVDGGRELARLESTTTQTGITTVTTLTDFASLPFTVVDYPVVVELFVPWIASATAGLAGSLGIADATPTTLRVSGFTTAATTDRVEAIVRERITTPGSYTRVGRIQRNSGSGTITVLAGTSTTVAEFRAYEVPTS